jgi:hypothetical protein
MFLGEFQRNKSYFAYVVEVLFWTSVFCPHFARLLSYFAPILKNYLRNEGAMLDTLQALEVTLQGHRFSTLITRSITGRGDL